MCYWVGDRLVHTDDCTCDDDYENGKEGAPVGSND